MKINFDLLKKKLSMHIYIYIYIHFFSQSLSFSLSLSLYIYIYIQVNKEIKSDSIKKSRKKQNNPKVDECFIKVDVKRFGYDNLLQDF